MDIHMKFFEFEELNKEIGEIVYHIFASYSFVIVSKNSKSSTVRQMKKLGIKEDASKIIFQKTMLDYNLNLPEIYSDEFLEEITLLFKNNFNISFEEIVCIFEETGLFIEFTRYIRKLKLK